MAMEPYEPTFAKPYPDGPWAAITDFVYRTPIYLCRAIEAVQRREGEDADYIVAKPYTVRFKLDGHEREITVPQGMLTDLSSVPWYVRWLVARVGPHLEASIVHDFLYVAWQGLEGRGPREEDREFADKLLRAGMEEAGVAGWRRFAIYGAVRCFGAGPYRSRDPVRFVRLPLDPA